MKNLFSFILLIFLAGNFAAQSTVAHINSQLVLDKMPSRNKAVAEITQLEKNGTAELQRMDSNMQKQYSEYMARKESQSLALNQYDENRIQKLQQDLVTRQQEIEKMMNDKNKAMNDKILIMVKDAVAAVAAKKGINYVLDSTAVLFANGEDITNEVIKELLLIDK